MSVSLVPDRSTSSADADVHAVVHQAAAAHAALMRGHIARYRALMPQTEDFTLMSPFGGEPTRGATVSDERWAEIGRFFKSGRDSTLELVQSYCSADLVVLAVIERTHVAVGNLAAQPWALRVTLVFRRQGDRWLLAHRHADPLAGGIAVDESAALARRAPAVRNVTN